MMVKRILHSLLLLQMLVIPSSVAHSQALQGAWQGTLPGPGFSLPLVFDLTSDSAGTLRSPLQNFTGTLSYTVSGASVTIEIPSAHAKYRATLTGARMSGTWAQGLLKLPLTLDKTSEAQNSSPPSSSASTTQNAPKPLPQGAAAQDSISAQQPAAVGAKAGTAGGIDVSGIWWRTTNPDHLGGPNLTLSAAGIGYAEDGDGSSTLTYSVEGNQVSLSIAKTGTSFQATVSADQMTGTWSQNGANNSMTFKRVRSICPPNPAMHISAADCAVNVEGAQGVWHGIFALTAAPFTLDLKPDGTGSFVSLQTNTREKVGYFFQEPRLIELIFPSMGAHVRGVISGGTLTIDNSAGASYSVVNPLTREASTSNPAVKNYADQIIAMNKTLVGVGPPLKLLLGVWNGTIVADGTNSPVSLTIGVTGVGVGGPPDLFENIFQYTIQENQLTLTWLQPAAKFEGTFNERNIKGVLTLNGKSYQMSLEHSNHP